jgi:hypothetical protein
VLGTGPRFGPSLHIQDWGKDPSLEHLLDLMHRYFLAKGKDDQHAITFLNREGDGELLPMPYHYPCL